MRPSDVDAMVPHPRGRQGVSAEELEQGDEFEDDVAVAPVLDEDEDGSTPLDAAQAEEVEETVDTEFSADSLQLFLKDVGKVDLLTAAQEVELAKRIERG